MSSDSRSHRSDITAKTGMEKTNSIFEDMIAREFDELLADIKMDKQSKGLIYDDFEPLFLKYGFARIDQIPTLQKAFLAATGFVRDLPNRSIISGKRQTQFSKKVALMSMSDLKALVFCIRNLFDFTVLQDKVVNPAPLSKYHKAPLKLF